MASLSLAVVDYGAGNLRSVTKALESLGHRPLVTADPRDLRAADGVVFPGQGIARPAMERLGEAGMDTALQDAVSAGKPFFGVCLGLQLLFESSEEGDTRCLGILPGRVVRFKPGLKVPHMGWNAVNFRGNPPVFEGVADATQFYFVHSYYGVPQDATVTIGETEYGITFASAVAQGNLVATQFHPEKSGPTGVRLYDNFFRAAKGG
ncbi:MAG: imidazole glycerol phosphate synthase subunit HisH [Chloroflexi bacterium]|nr:imidazole glycerol phosphate synthase subunit HisH [Chloroflexota bacterium]